MMLITETECEHGGIRPHAVLNGLDWSDRCPGGTTRQWSDSQHLVMKNGFVFNVADVIAALQHQQQQEVDLFAKVARSGMD